MVHRAIAYNGTREPRDDFEFCGTAQPGLAKKLLIYTMIQSYAHILRQLAKERPDAPALTFAGETWTFAQLNARSSQTACALRAAGVGVGDRVALLTKNCAECFELMFACNKIGAILTGLNWRLAPAEIQSIVADAMPTVIIPTPAMRARLMKLLCCFTPQAPQAYPKV